MSKRMRFSKYSRRTSLNKSNSHFLPAVLAAVIFILICFVISVVVGLLLGKKADDYGGVNKFDISEESYYSGDILISPVEAYYFEPSMRVDAYFSQGITDFSICLRHADGSLAFASDIPMSDSTNEDYSHKQLEEYVEYIHDRGGRVCAYFYITSFDFEDDYLRELYKSYELALINESAKVGVDDIMLVGLNINSDNISEIVDYVSKASSCSDKTAIGALITPEIMKMTADGVYWAAEIRSVSDYIALDLRELPENANEPDGFENGNDEGENTPSKLEILLEDMCYYINSHSMRLVLSRENASLYESVKSMGSTNIQVIGD